MNCPKCQADNSDEAIACSLCYHPFKQKAPAQTAPEQRRAPASQPPAGPVTVSYYGLFDLTKGSYLFLQALCLGWIVVSLIGAYTIADATLARSIPPEALGSMSIAQVRSGAKVFFWIGLFYESFEAWLMMGKFAAKEAAAAA